MNVPARFALAFAVTVLVFVRLLNSDWRMLVVFAFVGLVWQCLVWVWADWLRSVRDEARP